MNSRVSEPISYKVEDAVDSLKGILLDIGPILPELMQVSSEHYILKSTYLLIVWNKEEFPKQWKESLIKQECDKTILFIKQYHYDQVTQNSFVRVYCVCI